MKTYKETMIAHVASITCDKCGKCANRKDPDFSEFLSIEIIGGYDSKHWGDLTKAEIDLCEECHYGMFKDFAKLSEMTLSARFK